MNRSFQRTHNSLMDETHTETTLSSEKKRFCRKPQSLKVSRELSRQPSRERLVQTPSLIPYIRLARVKDQQNPSFLQLSQHSPGPLSGQITFSSSPNPYTPRKLLSKSICRDTCTDKDLRMKVEELLEETIMRQEELNGMALQKQHLQMEINTLKTKCRILDEANDKVRRSEDDLKGALKKLVKEKNLLVTEKTGLVKKVADLEKKLFPERLASMQSLREKHLENELSEARRRLAKQKSESQNNLLETQISELREKLFCSNRLLETLRINNLCLQQKNQNLTLEVRSTPELAGLRAKYRKALSEKNQLIRVREMTTRQIDSLVRENQQLVKDLDKNRQRTLPEESLDYSMVSNISELLV